MNYLTHDGGHKEHSADLCTSMKKNQSVFGNVFEFIPLHADLDKVASFELEGSPPPR